MKEIFYYATPKQNGGGYDKDVKIEVWVAQLWNKKFAIYKQSFKADHTGYKVYLSLEDIKKDFILETKSVQIGI